jgi:hypothetical protein
MDSRVFFTIGHSNPSWDDFVSLLLRNHITIIADVRCYPSSRLCPQFNKGNMLKEPSRNDIVMYNYWGPYDFNFVTLGYNANVVADLFLYSIASLLTLNILYALL